MSWTLTLSISLRLILRPLVAANLQIYSVRYILIAMPLVLGLKVTGNKIYSNCGFAHAVNSQQPELSERNEK